MTQRTSWLEKAAALLFVIFCFELGVFLIVFPWLQLWEYSYFSNIGFSFFGQAWEKVWDSAWLRGAVSGLGVVNVIISLVEVSRLRSGPPRNDNMRQFPPHRSDLQ